MTTHSARIARLCAAIIVAGGAGGAMFVALRPRHVAPNVRAAASSVGTPQQHIEKWREAPSVPPTESDRIAASLREAIDPPTAEPDRFTPRLRTALEETIRSHIDALCSDSPMEFMRLLANQRVRWIPPDAPEWAQVDFAMQHLSGRPADRGKPRETLELLLRHTRFTEEQYPFKEVALGPRGMRIAVEVGRTASDMERALIYERSGVEEHDYWNKGGRHGIRMSVPATSAADVLRKHGRVVFAQSAIQFRIVRNGPVVWHASWFWDPDSEVWMNHGMALESYYGAAIFY